MANLRDLNSRSNPVPAPLLDLLNALSPHVEDEEKAEHPEGSNHGGSGAGPPQYEDPPASVPDGPAGPPSGQGPAPHHHGHRGSHRGPTPHNEDPLDGHWTAFGGPFGGPFGGGPFGGRGGHGSPHRACRGGWGGRGRGRWGRRGSPFENWGDHTGGFDMSKIQEFIGQFASNVFPGYSDNKDTKSAGAEGKDIQPPVDIFDTQDAFIVHVSLSGAKKEDVGVNWDADKSELSIAGVIYRPGDEATLKTLALDEREVGAFERKVVLGTKLSPAQVDQEGISAKMEDGVLIVNIPKLEQDFVEVKKVEIE